MADEEFDLDLRHFGAGMVLDPNNPAKGEVKVKVYATKAPCGTPNPPCTAPPTHIFLIMNTQVVADVNIEE